MNGIIEFISRLNNLQKISLQEYCLLQIVQQYPITLALRHTTTQSTIITT